jgi:hypothetical protein
MNVPDQSATCRGAYDDLLRRSLSKISGDLGRLIYLASTRDYNTGTYHHEGLAARFRSDVAGKALEAAHRQVFYKISACALKELVEELEIYIHSSRQSRKDVLHVWQKLEPYRVAIPVDVNRVVARLFLSNVRLALAVLRQAPEQQPARP